jgi:hypothetical protein
MGYTTGFEGRFHLDKPLRAEHAHYLYHFARTRRMRRDAQRTEALPDPVRLDAGLPIGPEAAYFVGGEGFAGQADDDSVVDYNKPPGGQPGLWCHWVPTKDRLAIAWDGGEKFYCYVEWLKYLIEIFLDPWGYSLNGEVTWAGEEYGDTGIIRVVNNVVQTVETEDRRDPASFYDEDD